MILLFINTYLQSVYLKYLCLIELFAVEIDVAHYGGFWKSMVLPLLHAFLQINSYFGANSCPSTVTSANPFAFLYFSSSHGCDSLLHSTFCLCLPSCSRSHDPLVLNRFCPWSDSLDVCVCIFNLMRSSAYSLL